MLRHDPISLVRKDSELPHGVDGKAPLLFPLAKGTILEKCLYVLPAKRFLGEKPSLLLALKIVPKACNKKIFLVAELCIQSRLVHACGSFQILKAGIRKSMLPEDRHRLLQHFLAAKTLRASHRHIIG